MALTVLLGQNLGELCAGGCGNAWCSRLDDLSVRDLIADDVTVHEPASKTWGVLSFLTLVREGKTLFLRVQGVAPWA